MRSQLNASAISPLRQRLIDDVNLRHFGNETQGNYLRDIERLASFLGCQRRSKRRSWTKSI